MGFTTKTVIIVSVVVSSCQYRSNLPIQVRYPTQHLIVTAFRCQGYMAPNFIFVTPMGSKRVGTTWGSRKIFKHQTRVTSKKAFVQSKRLQDPIGVMPVRLSSVNDFEARVAVLPARAQ